MSKAVNSHTPDRAIFTWTADAEPCEAIQLGNGRTVLVTAEGDLPSPVEIWGGISAPTCLLAVIRSEQDLATIPLVCVVKPVAPAGVKVTAMVIR